MTTQEFSDQFDVLYNNIMSNQAPGLDEYEKSVFLTKAQEELVLAYFNPKSNKVFEGFDGSERRQIDFSMLIRTVTPATANATVDIQGITNAKYYVMPVDILLYINEAVTVARDNRSVRLAVVPINYVEYNRLMSKPFKRPLKNQAWRLISSGGAVGFVYNDYAGMAARMYDFAYAASSSTPFDSNIAYASINGQTITGEGNYIKVNGTYYVGTTGALVETAGTAQNFGSSNVSTLLSYLNKPVPATSSTVEIIPGPNDTISGAGSYVVRYVARPTPIITANLTAEQLTINGQSTAMTSQLDPILHQEILQRAVELAKAAYTGDLSSQLALGTNSETEKGMLTQSSR